MQVSEQRNAFGVNTYSYTLDHTAEEAAEKLAKFGYGFVEFMVYPGHFWPPDMDAASRRAFRDKMSDLGLRVTSVNMPNIDINIAAATPQMRDYSLGMLEAAIRLAGDVGAEFVIVGPGKANPLLPPSRQVLLSHLTEGLDRLIEVADDAGTEILLENMPFSFLPSIADILSFLETYETRDLGVIYDVANGHFIGADPCEEIRLLGSKLKLLHLSDTGQTAYRHDAVGLGDVDFASVPPALKDAGYSGPPVLEVIDPSPDTKCVESTEALIRLGFG